MKSVVSVVQIVRESQSDGITNGSTSTNGQHCLWVRRSFTADAAPSELRIYWGVLPGVAFAMRTLPQAEKYHRIRDSVAENLRGEDKIRGQYLDLARRAS